MLKGCGGRQRCVAKVAAHVKGVSTRARAEEYFEVRPWTAPRSL